MILACGVLGSVTKVVRNRKTSFQHARIQALLKLISDQLPSVIILTGSPVENTDAPIS